MQRVSVRKIFNRGIKNKTALLTTVLHHATPLEAKYLVKLLAGDLRIGLREGLVEDAIARVFGRSLEDVAYANMLLGDIGETATRARVGELRDINMRLFHPIKFMLATPAADLTDVARTMPEEFLVEDKFDGIRAQAHVASGRVAIYSRTMDEITHRFPELVGPLQSLPTDMIIDGEIVPSNGDVILPFSELQKRLGRKNVGTQLLQAVPVALVAYDLLYAGGKVLIDQPLSERRNLLGQVVPQHGTLRMSQDKLLRDAAMLDEEFERARARGNEGLMIKSPGSPYKPGRRGRDWLKLKRAIRLRPTLFARVKRPATITFPSGCGITTFTASFVPGAGTKDASMRPGVGVGVGAAITAPPRPRKKRRKRRGNGVRCTD